MMMMMNKHKWKMNKVNGYNHSSKTFDQLKNEVHVRLNRYFIPINTKVSIVDYYLSIGRNKILEALLDGKIDFLLLRKISTIERNVSRLYSAKSKIDQERKIANITGWLYHKDVMKAAGYFDHFGEFIKS